MSRKQEMLKPRLLDRGTFAGSFAAVLVLAAWLIVEFGHGSHRAEASESKATVSSTPSPDKVEQTASGAPAAIKTNLSAWKSDPRWKKATALGDGGLEQFKKALRWKEEKGGDPFYFAAQVKEAGDKVQQALRSLKSLRTDFENDSPAVSSIDKKIRYYEERTPRRRK
jgi:hypothetical protein